MNDTNIKENTLAPFGNPAEYLPDDRFFQLRKEGLRLYEELGIPTTKNEEWRFTNIVAALRRTQYEPYIQDGGSLSQTPDISPFLIPDLRASHLVFINGIFSPSLSEILEEKNILVTSFGRADGTPDIDEHLSRYQLPGDGLSALNQALFSDGAVIKIQDNAEAEYPVHLIFISGNEDRPLLIQPRNLVIAGKNSRAQIIESYYSAPGSSYVINSVSEIYLDEYAILSHYRLQSESEGAIHVNRTQLEQMQSSVYNATTLTLGGDMVRNDLNTRLAGKYSEAHFYGIYLTDKKNHVDNHTLIDHAMPECHSNELYKGIMDGDSRAVFNGKVIVRKDAQKTLAYQSNKNLLLSMGARVNTKPQLEIFADDVKCSHGATVGQLDPDSLFYLISRGIGREKARSILIQAFASDVTDQISLEPLRRWLEEMILNKLHTQRIEA